MSTRAAGLTVGGDRFTDAQLTEWASSADGGVLPADMPVRAIGVLIRELGAANVRARRYYARGLEITRELQLAEAERDEYHRNWWAGLRLQGWCLRCFRRRR